MKAFTDLFQSKKLAEILPIESADMRYSPLGDNMHPWIWTDTFIEKDAVPCWSLAALLDVIPFASIEESTIYGAKTWFCTSVPKDTEGFESNNCDNPIDACVEMIIRLHEQKIL